jgi:alpha-L-rhamnosidase
MTENLRKARSTDTYILKGAPEGEEWVPRFTYHGFQYCEVTGFKSPPNRQSLTGLSLGANTPKTSSFECSDPVTNQLFKNIVRTQGANFLEILVFATARVPHSCKNMLNFAVILS